MCLNQDAPFLRKAFIFTEYLEEGVFEVYSCGNGRFIQGTPGTDYEVCFRLYKKQSILDIQIHEDSLLQWLRAIPSLGDYLDNVSISMALLLPRYPEMSAKFDQDKRDGHSFDTLELFVHHFLREGSIFATFGLEHLHEEHILTELHLHDIQSQKNRSMSEDLDLLDEAIDELDEEDIKGPRHPFLFINEPFLSQLRAAIRQRDLIAVHSLLAMDPGSVDAKTLCLAIRYYEKTVFHLLLKHGAQVDGAGFIAEPLYRAAKAGHLDAVQLLISYGANKEGGNSCISATPLSGAASGGHFEIVQYLVEEKGANIMGKRFKSSLSRAIKHRHTHIVDYLLKVGANVLEENAEILSQLEETNKVVYGDILERSLARMDNYNRQDLFSRALSEGNLVVVRYLVKTGADVNQEVKQNSSPLAVAALNGHLEIVRYLVEASANVNLHIDRKENFSALAAAASKGHFAIVRYLVEAGAIVNPDTRHLAADRYRRECLQECSTPLAVAASNGHLAIVRYLVAAGANVNPDLRHRAAGDSDDSNGKIGWCSLQHYSPLAAAAKSRRSEVTQFLSSMGATLLEGEDMIQDYRLSWIPFDDTGTTCFDGADTTVGEFLENIRQSAVIDMKDPAVAAIQAQERKTMTRRLLAKVANSCERLLDAGTVQDASTSLIAFVGQVSTSSSVWKSGTRAIRDICEGYMPRRLSDVVSALQVANAMRSVIPSSQLECSKKEFVNDIPRWAALLRPDDQRLFFEIASHLWGIPASTTTQKEASNFARPLMVLQYLVSHLVRTSGLFDHGFGNPRGSYRLQTLRQQNLSVLRYNRSCERRLPLTEWHPLPTQGPQESLQTNNPSPPDPEEKQFSILARITMLMAGAIFSAILLYLCLSRYGFSTLRLPILISNAGQGWASDQIIRRNYIILATYIGFTSLVDFGSEKSTDLVLPKLSPLSLILPDSPSAEGVQEHIAAVQSPYYGDYAMNNTPSTTVEFAPMDYSPSMSSHLTISSSATTISPSTMTTNTYDLDTTSTLMDGTICCGHCNSKFKLGKNGRRGQASNIQKHMRNHHPETITNYQRVIYNCCYGCGARDPNKSNIKVHERKHCPNRKGKQPRHHGKWRQATTGI